MKFVKKNWIKTTIRETNLKMNHWSENQEDNVDFASLEMGEQAKKNNKKYWSWKPDTKEKSKKMRNLKMASTDHTPNLLIYKEIHIKC